MIEIVKENKVFYGLFFLWCIIGAVLQFNYSKTTLFFAVNSNYTPTLDVIMSICTEFGAHIIPFVLLSIFILKECRTKKYFLNIFLFLLIPLTMYLLKLYFDTPRPLTVYGHRKVHILTWLTNLYECSFPSGHTMAGFGFFTLLTLFTSKINKLVSVLFFVLALSVAYSRLYLGQHFFEDVYTGSIIGVCLVTFMYYLVNKFTT
jgi:membrane-associated phospholipid phosphatase